MSSYGKTRNFPGKGSQYTEAKGKDLVRKMDSSTDVPRLLYFCTSSDFFLCP